MSFSRGLSTQPARVLELVNIYVSGWSQTYNKATVTLWKSAMMTAVSCLFFAYVQEKLREADPTTTSTSLFDALSALSYLGVIYNCYAAAYALLNADRISQTPLKIAQRTADEPDVSAIRGHILSIILYHAKVQFWTLFRAYWIWSFIAGYLIVCVELVLYAWAFTERLIPQIFASTLIGVTVLPLGVFWLK